ncbi:MAG: ubiquinol-cytochrome C chaperone family protein [Pseudomonadota bacterium]
MVLGLNFLKFQRREADPRVRVVYDRLVAQARSPSFYADFGVADTLTGRFDMIVLHCFLYFYRIKGEDETVRTFGQEVFDTFIADMDHSLRELGVGYQAVPKRMKKMGEAFYGRTQAYDAAVEDGEPSTLEDAIARNLFPDDETASDPALVSGLARYVRTSLDLLEGKSTVDLLNGAFDFPQPSAFLPSAAGDGA